MGIRFAILKYFCYFYLILISHDLVSQNLVPNPGFDIVEQTITISGQLELAKPWRIVSQTPDLFGPNPNWQFLRPPLIRACDTIRPYSGQYFAGITGYNRLESEAIAVRLIEPLKQGVAYYVAAAVKPDVRCTEEPFNNLCHSSGLEISFLDFRQSIIPSIFNDQILKQRNHWEILQTCHVATGAEREITIGQTSNIAKTQLDCAVGSDTDYHFSFYYIDDVVVDPFDVLPDKILLCRDSFIQFDIAFYGLPLRWEDGILGGTRSITQAGIYKIYADVGQCELMDMVEVIVWDPEPQKVSLAYCEEQRIVLTPALDYPTLWQDGDISKVKTVHNSGNYIATLITECGHLNFEFEVDNQSCDVKVIAPNIVHASSSGPNQIAIFYFHSEQEISGVFRIYDRWGNLVYSQFCHNECQWDGTIDGKELSPQVMVWTFEIEGAGINRNKVLHGNITVIR